MWHNGLKDISSTGIEKKTPQQQQQQQKQQQKKVYNFLLNCQSIGNAWSMNIVNDFVGKKFIATLVNMRK
jgi:hypothetical protein